jgi:hypothetical protein
VGLRYRWMDTRASSNVAVRGCQDVVDMTCTIPVRLARERLDAGNVKIPTMKRLDSLLKGAVGKRLTYQTLTEA